MIFFVCFHMGFTKLGNLLKTRSSLVLKVPNKPTTLLHAEFTQHLKVLHSSHSTSPQIVTGRWNLGNLGPHHSVDLRLHMGWKTLAHHAGGDLAAAHVEHLQHFPFIGDWVDGDYQHHGEADDDGEGHDGQDDARIRLLRAITPPGKIMWRQKYLNVASWLPRPVTR